MLHELLLAASTLSKEAHDATRPGRRRRRTLNNTEVSHVDADGADECAPIATAPTPDALRDVDTLSLLGLESAGTSVSASPASGVSPVRPVTSFTRAGKHMSELADKLTADTAFAPVVDLSAMQTIDEGDLQEQADEVGDAELAMQIKVGIETHDSLASVCTAVIECETEAICASLLDDACKQLDEEAVHDWVGAIFASVVAAHDGSKRGVGESAMHCEAGIAPQASICTFDIEFETDDICTSLLKDACKELDEEAVHDWVGAIFASVIAAHDVIKPSQDAVPACSDVDKDSVNEEGLPSPLAAVRDVNCPAELTDEDKQAVHDLVTAAFDAVIAAHSEAADTAAGERCRDVPFQHLPTASAGPVCASEAQPSLASAPLTPAPGQTVSGRDAHACEGEAVDRSAASRAEGVALRSFEDMARFVRSEELNFDDSEVRCKAKGGKKQRKRDRHNRKVVVQIGTPW